MSAAVTCDLLESTGSRNFYHKLSKGGFSPLCVQPGELAVVGQ